MALGLCLVAFLAMAGVNTVLNFRGRINSTVTDNTLRSARRHCHRKQPCADSAADFGRERQLWLSGVAAGVSFPQLRCTFV